MKPKFKLAELEAQIIDWGLENEKKFIIALRYIGEEFVNRARSIDTYKDRTSNLRSSIGYVVAKDGVILRRNYKQFRDAKLGVARGLNLAEQVVGEYPNGIILVVTAGMEYGLYVEAMNFDVLTGSIPNRGKLLDSFYKMIQ